MPVLPLNTYQTRKLGDKNNHYMFLKPWNLVSGGEPGEIIQVSHVEEYPRQFASISISSQQHKLLVSHHPVFSEAAVN